MSSDPHKLIDAGLEAMVLGSILQGGEPEYREVGFLAVDDFAVEKHRRIFDAIVRIAPEIEITCGAVFEELSSTGKEGECGGLAGLLEVQARGIPGMGIDRIGRQLRQKAVNRQAYRLNQKLTKTLELGFSTNSEDVRVILEQLRELEDDTPAHGVDRIEDLPAVSETQEPLTYIADPELPEGSILALVGDSGGGKSTLAAALVRNAIASGRPGLILDRENPRHHALDVMARIGLSDGPLLRWYGGWIGQDAPRPDSAVVVDWVKAATPKPIVVIDSLSAFLEGDENSAADMRRFMHTARRLADLGAGVVILHHDGKADSARDYRGSSDFKAASDQAFNTSNVSSDPGKLDRIRLRCFKSRFGFSGVLVYHYAGGRMVRDERADAPAITVADQLTGLLRQNPGIGTREFETLAVKQGLGRNRTRDFINDGVLAGVIRRENSGSNQFRHFLSYPTEKSELASVPPKTTKFTTSGTLEVVRHADVTERLQQIENTKLASVPPIIGTTGTTGTRVSVPLLSTPIRVESGTTPARTTTRERIERITLTTFAANFPCRMERIN